jgi:hypothetical protein
MYESALQWHVNVSIACSGGKTLHAWECCN